jgi:predicted RNase H-like nuclease
MIAGVDGCKSGWVAAIDDSHGVVALELFEKFAQILKRKELRHIVIDIPIGLTEAGLREADKHARAVLGNRGCCVFPAPIRAVLDCTSQESASERWRSIDGRGCTAQLWGIIPKIVEVDMVMRATPTLQRRVREGHPEVSFAIMNGGLPVAVGKAKADGQRARREILATHFAAMDERLAGLRRSLQVDAVDAFSMLWTARRVVAGTEVRFPERVKPDRFGLYPRIVA